MWRSSSCSLHGVSILKKTDRNLEFSTSTKESVGVRIVEDTKSKKETAGDSASEFSSEADSSTTFKIRNDSESNELTTSASYVLIATIPVTVYGPNDAIETFAVLDSGSEGTMVSKSTVSALGLECPSSTKTFSWFDGSCVEMKTSCVNFKMTNADCSKAFVVRNAYEVDNINISKRKINWPLERKNYSHLSDLKLAATDQSLVTVLIGRDVRDVHDILDYRKPPAGSDAPEAILFYFGWCVVGPVSDFVLLSATDNVIGCHQISCSPTN